MQPYIRKAHFYETDQMGIVHHSNYIRWFEEARTDFFDKIGYSYNLLEKKGISAPLIGIECTYKTPVEFDETVAIHVKITEMSGVRVTMQYTAVKQETGQVSTTGESRHCFTGKGGKPVFLKRICPAAFDVLLQNCPEKGRDI